MLTKKQVIEEHDKLVYLFGGSLGINYDGKMERSIEKFDENQNKKEACIEFYYDILIGHPFIDGNKRVAWECLDLMLDLNGCRINAATNQAFELMMKVIEHKVTVQEIADWVRRHSK